MKIKSCELCGKSERAVHTAAMHEIADGFERELTRLMVERARIVALLKDVMWYNFEVTVRGWKDPWPESFMGSILELHAHRYDVVPTRGGRLCEKAHFPLYYSGSVAHAPPLPPDICMRELEDVTSAIEYMKECILAPYEWAPGGRRYEEMMRTSEGVSAYYALSSNCGVCSDDAGTGLLLGDRLEREVEESTGACSDHVLGRVCRD